MFEALHLVLGYEAVTMAPLIERCVDPLCDLACQSPSECRKQLRRVPNYLIDGIGECCHNVLRGNLPLDKYQLRALSPYKNVIRQVGNQDLPVEHRRRILIEQSGGFLPLLLRTALPFVISYIGDRLSR